MKRLITVVVIAGALIGTVVGQEPSARPAQGSAGVKAATADVVFMRTAAMDGLAEVEHGRLATQNAAAADVKQFAQHMVDDHSKQARS